MEITRLKADVGDVKEMIKNAQRGLSEFTKIENYHEAPKTRTRQRQTQAKGLLRVRRKVTVNQPGTVREINGVMCRAICGGTKFVPVNSGESKRVKTHTRG